MNVLMASLVYCLAGSNPGSTAEFGNETGLHLLQCDTATGKIEIVQTVSNETGTTYFQWLEGGNRVISSASCLDAENKRRGALKSFRFADGRLDIGETLAILPCEAPCHVALSPDETKVAFAAYSSGTVGVYDIPNAKLQTRVLPNDAIGPRKDRQQKAYAHCAFFLPDRQDIVGFVDLGCDRIVFFNVNDMTMLPDLELKFQPGDGPRHVVLSADGNFLYVVNELSSSVVAFKRNGLRFELIDRKSIVPEATSVFTTKAAAIKLTADGKILMASNRGEDSIAFFDVRSDGTLSHRGISKLNGSFPRDFELMPDEKFMIVGHKMSNEIAVYSFDRNTASIQRVGEALKVWRPLCFKFR